ncbi:ClpP/crotonase-like domain-containing protein [Ochromonadaceae sp. CCMP2298]|nr:ClpP/crotonase-like domain-containing protein [Ochromonadaceae sp. CCMP2298]
MLLASALLWGSLALAVCLQCESSTLSSFKPEKLRIRLKKRPKENDVRHEALDLMRNHFIRKHKFSNADWENFRRDLFAVNDTNQAMRSFMQVMDDPYSRYIEAPTMTERHQKIRGVSVGVGVELERRLHISPADVGLAVRTVLGAYTSSGWFLLKQCRMWGANATAPCPSPALSGVSPGWRWRLGSGRRGGVADTAAAVEAAEAAKSGRRRWLWRQRASRGTAAGVGAGVGTGVGVGAGVDVDVGVSFGAWLSHIKNSALLCGSVLAPVVLLATRPGVLPLSMGVTHSMRSAGRQLCDRVLLASLADALLQLFPLLLPVEVVAVAAAEEGGVGAVGGILYGDQIVSVDGRSLLWASTRRVLRLLDEGEVGDRVRVGVRRRIQPLPSEKGADGRAGGGAGRGRGNTADMGARGLGGPAAVSAESGVALRVVDAVREYLLVQGVRYWPLPATQGRGVGYLHLPEFTDETFHEVVAAVGALQAGVLEQQGVPMQALVIDLRGNPGGPLVPALDVASLFLPAGRVVICMSVNGRVEQHRSRNRRADQHTSLLLLTDQRTASASEILLEALCDNQRAQSMGQRTVGKNVAQAILGLSDGSGLCFTVREFFSPSGRFMGSGHEPQHPLRGTLDLSKLHFREADKSWVVK